MSQTADVEIRDLTRLIRSTSAAGAVVAEYLERGQADTPLAAMFADIEAQLHSAPFGLTLIGLTREARSAALAWLTGLDYRVLTVNVPEEVGLVQIRLQDRGFLLEHASGLRQEFDRLDPFLEAISRADLVQSGDPASWVDPLRLAMQAPAGLQGLQISMPENVEAITRSPGVLGRLVSESALAVIVGPAEIDLSDEARDALAAVSQGIGVVWPIVLGADGAESHRGWWSQVIPAGVHGSAAMRLRHGELPAVPEGLSNPDAPLRRAIFANFLGRRLRSAADIVAERHESALRQATARQRREARKARPSEPIGQDPGTRTAVERIKTLAGEELTVLQNGIKDANRKAMLRSGPLMKTVSDLVASLKPQDLERTVGSKSVQLSLKDDFKRDLLKAARKALRARLTEDFVLLRDGVEAVREGVERTVGEVSRSVVSVPITLPGDEELWASMKEMLEVDFRYRGEIPKRGFIQRLGEGRRMVFMMLMVISLVGGFAGRNLRGAPVIGLAMLAVFVASVAFTFRSWKREEQESLEKEIVRVRETVQAEVERVLGEIQREKLSRLGAVFEQVKKSFARGLEDASRDLQQRAGAEAARERETARRNLQFAESRLREIQGYAQQVRKLQQDAADVGRKAADAVRACSTPR